MENIEEFKLQNKDDLLCHSFQELLVLRLKYDYEIEYTLMQMKNYPEDVQHIMKQNMDIAIISHLTYNLNHQLIQCYKRADEYYKASRLFLTGDDDAYYRKYIDEFLEYEEQIKNLENKFKELSIFEVKGSLKDPIYVLPDSPEMNIAFEGEHNSLLRLERELANMNGAQLIKCLIKLIDRIEKRLFEIWQKFNYIHDEEFEYIYDLNYVYYADNYWNKNRFRHRVETNYLLGGVSSESLKSYYRDVVRDFTTNETGKIWGDYSDDRGKMAYELLRLSINNEQWEYFFKNIFAIEELRNWAEELKNPKKLVSGLRAFVVKQEIADNVVEKIIMYVNSETRPKPIVRSIRAAMDAAVLHRPTWDAFVEEFGENKISSKTSFNEYTNPEKKEHYTGASYQQLVDEFRKLLD